MQSGDMQTVVPYVIYVPVSSEARHLITKELSFQGQDASGHDDAFSLL